MRDLEITGSRGGVDVPRGRIRPVLVLKSVQVRRIRPRLGTAPRPPNLRIPKSNLYFLF